MKIKTSELTGHALNWAVAKCAGFKYAELRNGICYASKDGGKKKSSPFTASTNWAQAGPIIELAGICTGKIASNYWVAFIDAHSHKDTSGPTPLIAAMRCFIAYKLGEEVSIPQELGIIPTPQSTNTI